MESGQVIIERASKSLIEKVRASNPKAKIEKIKKALEFAIKLHDGQTRASGEPYVTHPIAVAEILTELNLDTASIITAILHDTLEDTKISLKTIEKEFGSEVAKLVDGVTKLAKIEFQPEHIKQAENFRKLLLAISEDIRVLMVKLADRLHNMRTIHYLKSTEKRLRISHETMEIYSPLAERIGIHKFKNELQDLAFAELYPEIRESILSRLEFLRQKGTPLIDTIVNHINKTLQRYGIEAEVEGREKTTCSIWRKMENKKVSFEQLADIIAFRILVKDTLDCYRALGVIHTNYHMIPGGFKDFISTPKANGYESLHTVVMGPEQRCIEIQIRTFEMHQVAELGVAAHWAYKQKQSAALEGTHYRWIRELLEILENASNAEEFLENTKLEMYYDQVFCFSPKGDLIALPRGATPVDFAFSVHSDMGLSCIGARVNGRIAPLKTQLENGDQVEILRSKTPMPSPTWEKFVVTGKARAEIKRYMRSKQKEEYFALGKAILTKTFQLAGKKFENKPLKDILPNFKKSSVKDLIASVGEGSIDRNAILSAMYPELKPQDKKSKNPLSLLKLRSTKPSNEIQKSMPIKGLIPGMAIHFANCCHPLPGDGIVGIFNTGKGIMIHTSDCEMLENFAGTPERWIDVSWEGTGDEYYTGRIKVIISNEFGSLAKITNAISSLQVNISNLKITSRSMDFYELNIDLEVKGLNQLNNTINAMHNLDCVHTVERAK